MRRFRSTTTSAVLEGLHDAGNESVWRDIDERFRPVIIGVALGVIVMKNPESVIRIIVLITAIFWLISGMVDLFRGLTDSAIPDRGLRIALGALTAAFGVAILLWPEPTVLVFAVFAGVYTMFFGVLEIVAAFQIKNA